MAWRAPLRRTLAPACWIECTRSSHQLSGQGKRLRPTGWRRLAQKQDFPQRSLRRRWNCGRGLS
eukprot:14237281-Alexandrium_andersonii.AAC.1